MISILSKAATWSPEQPFGEAFSRVFSSRLCSAQLIWTAVIWYGHSVPRSAIGHGNRRGRARQSPVRGRSAWLRRPRSGQFASATKPRRPRGGGCCRLRGRETDEHGAGECTLSDPARRGRLSGALGRRPEEIRLRYRPGGGEATPGSGEPGVPGRRRLLHGVESNAGVLRVQQAVEGSPLR